MTMVKLNDLVCPLCWHPFSFDDRGNGNGELTCTSCHHTWPVRNGIARLVPEDLVAQQRRTATTFGWQWRHFSEMHSAFEAQFLDWIHPISPEFFRAKRVLDAGCGTGRHAYFAAKYGAREVVGLDLSDAVEIAHHNLRDFENVTVVQGDLLRPPFLTAASGGGFDIIYSIGVLHHLPEPERGFRTLLRYLRPGGTIAIWVYGHENNDFVRRVVEPVRRISTRVSPSLLRGFAWPLGAAFHVVAKAVYRPLHGTAIGRALPLNEYMSSVADFSFRQNYGIVFDQLAAPTAAYITKQEIERWFERDDLDDVVVSHRHQNSWRAQGRAAWI
jgi:SAM-dependent methyltransferase